MNIVTQTVAARRFTKVLVANRGEIARRIVRALREMGIASVAVYSDADANAPYVAEADEAIRIGPAPSAESYLHVDRILEAARRTGADAVHPGYGFLSERADFARRCVEQGFVFVGPSADAIRLMGSKIESKRIAREVGVPVLDGFSVDGLDAAAVVERAHALGYPVLIKASLGGGGRGMRVVGAPAALPEALAAARREAAAAFGDGTLLVEGFLDAPRHVEVQIFGDAHGRVVHLFERECSIQRRHQKVVEEAPSPALDAGLRARMGDAAVLLGRRIGYVGAGTVEFLLDRGGAFHFLEMNTRLQVEHPVTEAITCLDLVRMQIDVAQGCPLGIVQDDLAIHGHAIEARLYAEDAEHDFLPAAGRVALWRPPVQPGLRIDAGVEEGSDVSVHYDPLLAKVIAHGASREEARRRLVHGLRALAIGGLATNRAFLLRVLERPAFVAGDLDTRFIERHVPAGCPVSRDAAIEHLHAVAAALYLHERRRAADGPLPASIPSGWRNNPWRPQEQAFLVAGERIAVRYAARGQGTFEVGVAPAPSPERSVGADALPIRVRIVAVESARITLEIDDVRRPFEVGQDGDRLIMHGAGACLELVQIPRFPPRTESRLEGGCVAPMTGLVRKVCIAAGDRVRRGTLLLVLEAMKMEHRLEAHADGVVKEVRVREGQMVDPDDVLVVLEADAE